MTLQPPDEIGPQLALQSQAAVLSPVDVGSRALSSSVKKRSALTSVC